MAGNPAVAYYGCNDSDLKYARSATSSGAVFEDWTQRLSLEIGVGSEGISLAVIGGNPAISYYDGLNDDLKYIRSATATGGSPGDWSTSLTLDTTGQVGWDSSLAEVYGAPAISYFDYSEGDLKFIQSGTSTGHAPQDWYSPTIVDRHDSVGRPTSLAVINGNPAICYQDAVNSSLKYAYYSP